MANKRWLGRAVALAQVDTITVADTWGAGDDVVLTINGKDLTITIGSLVTTAQVATTIKQAVNGETFTDTTATSNTTGNLIGEFARITATVASAVVTLTGDDLGVPFTLSVTEDTAGDGTATEATSVAATGPNTLDNADNWSGDAVPADGDDIIFDGSGVSDVLYNLAGLAIQPASVTKTSDFIGNIGLPKTNEDEPSLPYDEYREDYLTFANDTGTAATVVNIGDGSGPGSARVKIDFADCDVVTVNVYGSADRIESGVPAILLNGNIAANVLNVYRGDVAWSFYEGETGHLGTVRVGYVSNQLGDAQVVLGNDVDLGDANIDMSGGTLEINSATGTGTIQMLEGELTVRAGAHALIEVDGGACYYRSTGELTTARVGSGGTLSFARDMSARTVTNCEVHKDSTLLDPYKTVTWTNDIDFYRCSLAEVTIDVGTHFSLGVSAI